MNYNTHLNEELAAINEFTTPLELIKKLQQIIVMHTNHTDLTVEVTGRDGDYELTVYGIRPRTQEELDELKTRDERSKESRRAQYERLNKEFGHA